MKKFTIAAALVALPLAACSSSPSTSGSPAAAGGDEETPVVVAAGDVCSLSEAAVQISEDYEAATADIDSVFSDGDALVSGDMTSINAAGEALLEIAPKTVEYYYSAAALVDDPAVAEAFSGLGRFTDLFATAVGEAAASATTPDEYITALGGLGTNPELAALTNNAADYATTVQTFLQTECGIVLDDATAAG